MNYASRNEYMKTLQERYLRGSKKEKGAILDEYCRNSGQNRKYAIKRFRGTVRVKGREEKRKPRSERYDGPVKAALVTVWRIFDYPCGSRLRSILRTETDRLRRLGELSCSDETAAKLQKLAASTIDEKLKHEREVERQKRTYHKKRHPLLCAQVPTKTAAELDRTRPGVMQVDCVEHCGVSAAGEYLNSLSVVDIFSGWWEGEVVMGKGQQRALHALDTIRKRSPIDWTEIHPDNGGNIMNYHIYAYAEKHGITFSRSRPYHKNDNCFIEQKNSTHVRKIVGYLRYDAEEEQTIINNLYRNELRLYKNFFQPVMKLTEKRREGGKIRKKYDVPKTPYQRLLESKTLSRKEKAELKDTYQTLNPAELKRNIDVPLKRLLQIHTKKMHVRNTEQERMKKLVPTMVSYYIGQPV